MESEMSLEKKLFRSAMKGEWNDVVTKYEECPTVHMAKILKSGDTALHIAVSNGKEGVVEKLVQLIRSQSEHSKALEIRNEQGNTPLHIAASLGNVRMCKCIALASSSLLKIQNINGETPLFVAALHGKKNAFLCLYSFCGDKEEGYSYFRRDDGETVLHYAISGDYFDLAFQIIYLYKNLVNSENLKGISPLHLLASKPSAFRSGSHIDRCSQLIYHCIFVDQLKVEPPFQQHSSYDSIESNERIKMSYPDNYQTCMHLFRLLKQLFQKETQQGGAVSNLEAGNVPPETRSEGNKGPYRGGHQFFPSNYGTFIDFVKLLSKAMLVILGLGSRRIRKLREKKEKHVWAVQIMNELLEHASLYQYQEDEKNSCEFTGGRGDVSEPAKQHVQSEEKTFEGN
ncbi:hypothetical protein DITRI_Ditri11bG0088300 [Diplodiscus trichospermus]